MANELDDLAVKYGTDKSPQIKHSYTPYYYDLFKARQLEIKKVLEIGAGEGASLRMWQDFFPNAKIYSAENEDHRIFTEDRIEVIKCDQSSLKDLENLIEKTGIDIDFVVDDGSHIPAHQVFTCLKLMPLLKNDVIYIIEDVADQSIEKYFVDYNYVIPQLSHTKRRYDDRLVVIRNK